MKNITSLVMVLITLSFVLMYAMHWSDSPFIQSWARIVRFIIFIYTAAVVPIILVLFLTMRTNGVVWQKTLGWILIGILSIGAIGSYSWRGYTLVNECVAQGGSLTQPNKLSSFKFGCQQVGTNKILPMSK